MIARFAKPLAATIAVTLAATASSIPDVAPADVLCKEKPPVEKGVEVCPAPYSPEGDLTASSGDVHFAGGGFKVDCSSTMEIQTLKDLGPGKGLDAEMTKLAFGGCSGSCSSASALNLAYAATIGATGGGSGSLTYDSSGDPSLELKGCTVFKLTCRYDADGTPVSSVDFGGASSLSLWLQELARRSGGSPFCPEEITITGEYEIEQPEGPVFVSES